MPADPGRRAPGTATSRLVELTRCVLALWALRHPGDQERVLVTMRQMRHADPVAVYASAAVAIEGEVTASSAAPRPPSVSTSPVVPANLDAAVDEDTAQSSTSHHRASRR